MDAGISDLNDLHALEMIGIVAAFVSAPYNGVSIGPGTELVSVTVVDT